MRQTFLMSRILNRLPSKELEALASPGLVLGQVTRVLKRQVRGGTGKRLGQGLPVSPG